MEPIRIRNFIFEQIICSLLLLNIIVNVYIGFDSTSLA